ncbi:YpdA family putative bacillithiol disulfide reductase, partial [bacterium]|nr:YpdA family putative bacillithiol disulfide reductase [bacterium]
MTTKIFDVLIVGAGPTGLACAIECKKNGLSSVVIDKGCIVNSIYHFPANMIFFTTSDLLEIGGVPFTTTNPKPTREEGLNYYKRVVEHYDLLLRTNERVNRISKSDNIFQIQTTHRDGKPFEYRARFIIVATGYYDNPNYLHVPGEDLPKVSHYYTDPHPYFGKNILIVGGKNSACIAALELHRYGARVTVVHRKPEIKQSVKYWILPDFLNRVNEGAITLHVNSVIESILPESVKICNTQTHATTEMANDFVFALTGYRPDESFLRGCGIDVDHETLVPQHNPETLETNVPGLYVAGSISAGKETNKLFIENGRFHG